MGFRSAVQLCHKRVLTPGKRFPGSVQTVKRNGQGTRGNWLGWDEGYLMLIDQGIKKV